MRRSFCFRANWKRCKAKEQLLLVKTKQQTLEKSCLSVLSYLLLRCSKNGSPYYCFDCFMRCINFWKSLNEQGCVKAYWRIRSPFPVCTYLMAKSKLFWQLGFLARTILGNHRLKIIIWKLPFYWHLCLISTVRFNRILGLTSQKVEFPCIISSFGCVVRS